MPVASTSTKWSLVIMSLLGLVSVESRSVNPAVALPVDCDGELDREAARRIS